MEIPHNSVPLELNEILQQFPEVFKEHIQLPPKRSKVHHIKLFPDHGIIRPSMSAYSIPVILVKKKDRSWRMCVDYRALSKATIPDNLIDYLGHISGQGVAVDPEKVKCIMEWPEPKSVKGCMKKNSWLWYFVFNIGDITYWFEVKYKPGLDNKAADALSRCYDEVEFSAIVSYPTWVDRKKLLDEVATDVDIQKLLQELQINPAARPGYSVNNGVLFYHGRTYRRLADNLYWVGMQKSARDFVRSCDTCQRQKYSATTPGGLLQPLPIPNAIWEDLSVDFVTGLPKSKGYDVVLVVVDRLSKYSHFILLKHPNSAKSIAELFVKEIVRLHGIPKSIISDQSYLRCFASDQPKTWAVWIPWAEFWYNSTYNVSIGKTPFEVVYGRQATNVVKFLSNETKVAAVALELSERDEALSQLKIGEVAYKLQLPNTSKIHPDFHVSLLKKAVGNYHTQGELPKELEGKSVDDVTWEDDDVLRGQFPDFGLEDKAVYMEEGVDRNVDITLGLELQPKPRVWQVYTRKKVKGNENNDVAG
ncbi:hypothetical protein L195_g013478 [Trifolium pratense]|uniref:Integrase catalytic domain-containing protein n=1 Tax=Trifolium pratense TaxID=57577 RepID=A0A2K3PN97_TRIPR|nr:hypothetical protein L195_g013478 [Trifolium pratense]